MPSRATLPRHRLRPGSIPTRPPERDPHDYSKPPSDRIPHNLRRGRLPLKQVRVGLLELLQDLTMRPAHLPRLRLLRDTGAATVPPVPEPVSSRLRRLVDLARLADDVLEGAGRTRRYFIHTYLPNRRLSTRGTLHLFCANLRGLPMLTKNGEGFDPIDGRTEAVVLRALPNLIKSLLFRLRLHNDRPPLAGIDPVVRPHSSPLPAIPVVGGNHGRPDEPPAPAAAIRAVDDEAVYPRRSDVTAPLRLHFFCTTSLNQFERNVALPTVFVTGFVFPAASSCSHVVLPFRTSRRAYQ
jgi:hypothetical protein